jgi:hypothetical protein
VLDQRCAASPAALLLVVAGFSLSACESSHDDPIATVSRFCVDCHNDVERTADLTLESRDLADVAAHADVWEKVIRKVQVGMMPPPDAPHPDTATRRALVAALSGVLDEAARANPNPGRPALHRLNRSEYANAIRDLLDLSVDPATLLPPDDSAYGFDNVADVLGVSATLMEQYVSAAGKVSSLAVGDRAGGQRRRAAAGLLSA